MELIILAGRNFDFISEDQAPLSSYLTSYLTT